MLGTSVDLAAGVHGPQGRGPRCVGRSEGHQAPHVRGESPQPSPLLKKRDNSRTNVTEDMDPAAGVKYVLQRF